MPTSAIFLVLNRMLCFVAHAHRRCRIGRAFAESLALALAAACSFPDATINQGVTHVSVSDTVGVADGASTVNVVATINQSSVPAGQTVAFATSLGAFLPGGTGTITAPVDSTGRAIAVLVAPHDSGGAFITATSLGITSSASVRFSPAPPTFINIVPSQTTITSGPSGSAATSTTSAGTTGNDISLTITLVRTTGTPSPGFFITLTAAGATGDECSGVFAPDSVLAVANAATVLFSEPDSLCTGKVLIQAIASRGALVVTGSTTVVAGPKS